MDLRGTRGGVDPPANVQPIAEPGEHHREEVLGVRTLLGELPALRNGRGPQLQRSGDFGKLVYHEARISTPVDREGYLDLWRSRNRLRTLGRGGAFDDFLASVQRPRAASVEVVDVPYVFSAWSLARGARRIHATAVATV